MSETRSCRKRLIKFCEGCGVDLGCGHDKIRPEALGFDKPNPYAKVGNDLIELRGDATDLNMFNDNVLDYVYSSHLLEDFDNTEEVLREWVRVVKPGGKIVLYLPDQQVYVKSCKERGCVPNGAHKIYNFNKELVKKCAENIGGLKVIHETDIVGTYSFDLVFEKE